ncbi:MAG: hypothetical protein HeimC3_01090 [Candidatus Heimdallarchaeota archaeon LC_3]|nr:MAG: hypothetical protein HeimC3_01090 [Candidatus Heimdallarchaeota archaeon LC_3]
MSRVGIPRKVLDIYSNHIAQQEAEIEGLNNLLIDYRSKFGSIDLSSSPEFEKAKLERELQEIRKKNNENQLQLRTLQSQLSIKENIVKDMENALQELMNELSETKDPEITESESRVTKLEEFDKQMNKDIADLEESLKELLQQNRRREI